MKKRLNYFRWVVIVLALMVLCGCTPKTVTVERLVEREKKITAEVHDTTVVYDSTGVRVMGDTVFVDRWHTKTRTVVKEIQSKLKLATLYLIGWRWRKNGALLTRLVNGAKELL